LWLLGIRPRALYMLGKLSSSWATLSALLFVFCF
jgi:hypothetical protein